jgi:hypothetical protein
MTLLLTLRAIPIPMKTPYDTAEPLEARAMSQIGVQTVRWLWLHRLALGKIAMLDGDPDKGKSLVTLDLGARLSTGRDFPDGCPCAWVCLSPSNNLLFQILKHCGSDRG